MFLTDGGDEVRALTELVTPAREHAPAHETLSWDRA